MTIPRPSVSSWRDTLLFLTGLGLIIHEAVLRTGPERPTLLLLYAGMLGLPAFLRADEKRQDQPNPREPEAGS